MAYSATVNVSRPAPDWFEIEIVETDAGASDEAEIDLAALRLPTVGRVEEIRAARVSGTGTTIDPVLGLVTDPGGAPVVDVIAENDTAAAGVVLRYDPGVRYRARSGSLYHRSRVDAGSDNVIRTVIRLRAGW